MKPNVSLWAFVFSVVISIVSASGSFFTAMAKLDNVENSVTDVKKDLQENYATKEAQKYVEANVDEIKQDVKDIKNILMKKK